MWRCVIGLIKNTRSACLIAFAMLFFCSLSVAQNFPVDVETERLARWYINYASYLIDVGKYMEALENYETAYEISKHPKIKVEALLGKAMLLATFLDAPEAALKTYRLIAEKYPDKAELALYRQALLLYQLERYSESKRVLLKYQRSFPSGRFRFQVEALLKEIERAVPAKPKPSRPEMERVPVPVLRVRIGRPTKRVILGARRLCIKERGICRKRFEIYLKGSSLYEETLGDLGRKLCFSSQTPIKVVSQRVKKRLRGDVCLSIYRGRILIVNWVDIESYLLSVVPSESIASWPIESLKAQAVASRTYAYYQKLHRKNRAYDLVDNEGDQAYGGVDREHPRATRAVRETKGQILVYNKRPILAMFSANSGGYTADPKAVFDLKKPYLVAKPDPESLKGKMAKWKRRFTVGEVERRLNRIGIKVRGLVSIEPAVLGPSGRVVKVRIVDSRGSRVLRTRTTLRRALRLPDILMKIYKNRDEFIFVGRGFGHGVGYSQWGSAYMGKKKNYRDILRFYYPNTYLVKLW